MLAGFTKGSWLEKIKPFAGFLWMPCFGSASEQLVRESVMPKNATFRHEQSISVDLQGLRICGRADYALGHGKPVFFHWIPSHKDIKGNEEAGIAAKEATGWRRAKWKNGKWRKWDSGYTSEEQKLGRSRATFKLSIEQNTPEQWKKAWASERTE